MTIGKIETTIEASSFMQDTTHGHGTKQKILSGKRSLYLEITKSSLTRC